MWIVECGISRSVASEKKICPRAFSARVSAFRIPHSTNLLKLTDTHSQTRIKVIDLFSQQTFSCLNKYVIIVLFNILNIVIKRWYERKREVNG
ncbi:hypothetical protein DWB64_10205 [Fusibacter sp. A1]|nr:hypothetical protein DWB64_10205 [Fusibacter sp. A1]